MPEVLVGRQPIYDAELEVYAYELLFRTAGSLEANVTDGDLATSQVILNTFMEIGIDRLAGDKLVFINLTRNFITGKYPIPLPPDRVVLEILEDITIDKELEEAVGELVEQGYIIALDDIVEIDSIASLLGKTSIVKLEILGMDKADLRNYATTLKRKGIKILAEKVETHEEFEYCKMLGFDYYQGYFLSKPNIVEGKKILESKFTVLRLLSELQDPDLEIKKLEKVISQDVSLSYKLMRLINSVHYGTKERVNSLRQALTLLGLRQIKQWIGLIFLTRVEDKPKELMITAMVRAKMCEVIAPLMGYRNAEAGFTVGLFSVLDALLDMPLEDVLKQLPLSDETNSALLEHKGKLGAVLLCVIAYEQGDWDEMEFPKVGKNKLMEAYLEAIDWASSVGSELED